METGTPATEPQAGEGGQPQAGTTHTGETPTPVTTPQAGDTDTNTLEGLRAALKRANAEAASARVEHNKLKTQVEKERREAEQAKLSEDERRQQRIAELERENTIRLAEAQEVKTRLALVEALVEHGVRIQAARRAARLVDQAALEYDESGAPTNADTLVKELLKEMPELLTGKPTGETKPDSWVGSPARSQGAPTLTPEAVRRMTPQQINKNWPEISRMMAEGKIK